jgi:hypothetical protein
VLLLVGGQWRFLGVVLLLGYLAALLVSAVLAGLHFRSTVVGILMSFAMVATQVAYVVGFAAGLLKR